MIYIVVALKVEAQEIINKYKLKKNVSLNFDIYENKNIYLVISGMGRDNALMATTALLSYKKPKKSDSLINFGICASVLEIGTLLHINSISFKDKTFYPDILFETSLDDSTLTSFEEPMDGFYKTAVDMEAFWIYKVAQKFFKSSSIFIVKLVSDNFEPSKVNKENITKLINLTSESVIQFIELVDQKAPKEFYSENEEIILIELKKHFTSSQVVNLEDAIKYFKLKNNKEFYLDISLLKELNKLQKKKVLDEYISQLRS